jgi:cytochrome c oxidase subunit 2
MGSVRFIPPSASTFASEYDALFWFFMISCGAAFVVTSTVMIYFALRYRRGTGRYVRDSGHGHSLVEVLWSLPVFFVVTVLFVWGTRLYVDAYTVPEDAMEIYVTGKQWMWKVQHPSGKREINEIHIPVDTPIKLTMTSEDVIHSFFIPAFRLKRDVLPGRYTSMWFEANQTGEFHLFCAEFCGTEHSRMVGKVVVMTSRQYGDWIGRSPDVPGAALVAGAAPPPLPTSAEELATMAAQGEVLFQQNACSGCHMESGQPCPNLANVWGQERPMQSGALVVGDENYIRESILNPRAKVVQGYAPVMPTYAGRLDADQVNQLIAYIKALAPGEAPPPDPTPADP